MNMDITMLPSKFTPLALELFELLEKYGIEVNRYKAQLIVQAEGTLDANVEFSAPATIDINKLGGMIR